MLAADFRIPDSLEQQTSHSETWPSAVKYLHHGGRSDLLGDRVLVSSVGDPSADELLET